MLRSGTARTAPSDEARGQQSLGDLVGLALKDISQLVRYEIKLATSEFKIDLRRAGIGAGAVGFILMVAYPILFMLLFAEAYGLHAAFGGQPLWLCFIYSAATCAFFAVIVGLIGFVSVKKITGMKLTRKTVADDISMLKHAGSGDKDAASAIEADHAAAGLPENTRLPDPDKAALPENRAAGTVIPENTDPAAVTAGS